ncbi:YkvA family protein [Bacillus atrophaeus]|uniref:YkvA family protein n=1 Tax=Bacillus atrophaeus TaxID=1452 RepID=UPI00227E827F|nr:YkvA family protein [Bacillus atrophaeus]MCY8512398.1 DUF1232 domain-containing protein [Bacillus atrophaeus]MCY8516356.1 DUF1232 domain-containing protein [Bacillus atrophaeus]MCY8992914.1 DUF1232 domain-containing protein [Bacillus atrophaeus]
MRKNRALMLGVTGGKMMIKKKDRKKAINTVTLFFQMIRDWKYGRYHRSPFKAFVLVGIAFLYIVSPIDFIPDVILGLGLIDDAAVIGIIWTLLKKEISKYEQWQFMN